MRRRRTITDAQSTHSPRPRSTVRWDFSVAGNEEQFRSRVPFRMRRTSAESAWSPSERAADRQAVIAGTLSPRPLPAADSISTSLSVSPRPAGRGPRLRIEPRHPLKHEAASTVHQRHLPSATVHDPSWHPGRFKCYSLSDRVKRDIVDHSFRDEIEAAIDTDILQGLGFRV